ncbi:MAG TPA: cytochrome c oxidase assembly protein [Nitrococcus sp.]|nr:cytochrome c oxidase assembly protein [Nitrococcus sp.]
MLLAAVFAGPAWGRGVHAPGLLGWSWEPLVLAPLGLALAGYLLGVRRMGREQRRRILGRYRVGAFITGIVVLFIALESPLDALAQALFSAHMAQHMLLLLVAPPLLVAGRPVITWLWAFDMERRRWIGHAWIQSWLHRLFRWLTRPLVIWLLLICALGFWHLPRPYGWAVRHAWLHDLEHLSFLGFALGFWTIVIEPYGRRRALGYGATMVYVVSVGFVMGLIGAILTFAPRPLYAVYGHASAAYGLTALQDQQLAGVVMWVPAEMIHLGTLCVLFFAWFREDERRAASPSRTLPTAALRCLLIVPLLLITLAGCGGDPDPPPSQVTGGSSQRGAALIEHYGCGGCHTIPGITGANGVVGPPLTQFGERTFIAGLLLNRPDNLVQWISNPQKILPGVDMPDMGVTQKEARDIAAYLYTLR